MNELSLEGQFENKEDFLEAAVPVMKCLKFIYRRNGQVTKRSTFFSRKITKSETWNDLRGMKGDAARRMKSLLLATTDSPPFWDCEQKRVSDAESLYMYGNINVTDSSLAEAAEDKKMLLSFPNEKYSDSMLLVVKNESMEFSVPSATSLKFLTEKLWENKELKINDYISGRYEGSRLDFSELEPGYGFENFEKEEIEDCIHTFDRFVSLENWDSIFSDRSLNYKQYQPSSNMHNWFRGEIYRGKRIDKFRCVNPKRCFGYRKGNVFYVLRMERDHKISDYG